MSEQRCHRCEREAEPGSAWCRICEPTQTDREDELAMALIRCMLAFVGFIGVLGVLGWWLE